MITPQQLSQVNSFETLALLFYEELGWSKQTWSAYEGVVDDYGIHQDTGVQSIRAVQQLSVDQSWGIFLVDFGANRLRRSQLRAILHKVAERDRQQHAERTWAHENILFVCRSESTSWTLGHYTGDKLSNAKLKTFGWSDPLSARTFLTRNLPYLRWNDQSHWAKAWDADALTDEFYREYKRVFDLVELQTEHPKSSDTKKLFVQSLFNRLMFLAFIEKMGWLSIDGNKDYLYTLYERHKAKPNKYTPSFYHVLQLLFFSGLNSVNGIGGGHNLEPILGKVPYLNGGLFQPDLLIEPSGIRIPDSVFEEIFNDPHGLFRRYTFTVTESTPFDIDVAVDPEMLGKIFEELVTGRHESGSYYTPRPVVSFMCREALKGYFQENGIDATKAKRLVDEHNADDLKHGEISSVLTLMGGIKVVDPACGSGAYLLGMMRELFDLIQLVERRRTEASPRELYSVKLDIIQNNLYGVDIDPFAVNIARLRMWLSLAVDHKGGHPEPLPNLKFKIEAGDSLVAPNPTLATGQMVMNREADIREFERLKKEYGKPPENAEEAKAKDEIEKRIDTLRVEMRSWYGGTTSVKTGVFDWRVEFAEVFQDRHDGATISGNLNLGLEAGRNGQGELSPSPKPGGFDVVLANPPYVRADAQFSHLLPDQYAQRLAIAHWKTFRDDLKKSKIYETLHEKWDIYIPFLERGYQVLCPGGQMVFIIPDSYNSNKYAERSHDFLLNHCRLERIDFCSEIPLFDAGVYNTILRLSKVVPCDEHKPVRVRRWGNRPDQFEQNEQVLESYLQSDAGGRVFRRNAERNTEIMVAHPLGALCYVSKGMVVHADEKYHQGEFSTEDVLSDTPSEINTRRFVFGKDVAKWTPRRIRYLEWGTKRAPDQFSRATFEELQQARRKLVSVRTPGGTPKTIIDSNSLHFDASTIGFILWCDLSGVRNSSIAKQASYKGEIARGPRIEEFRQREELEKLSKKFDLRYLLGVMNSSFAKNWLKAERKSNLHLYPDDWKKLPIRDVDITHQQPVIELVDQILLLRESDNSADTESLEAELDDYVEFLYLHQISDETYSQWKARLIEEASSEVGALRAVMLAGEDDRHEFKASVIWDTNQDKHNLVMRDEVLKEICAFLNADGGMILCGVHDSGALLGLKKDLKHAGSKDKLGLVITSALGDLLKPHPVELVKMRFIDIDNETVLRIDVQPDKTNRYESPRIPTQNQPGGKPTTHVRVGASAKALEVGDAIAWWNRRSGKTT